MGKISGATIFSYNPSGCAHSPCVRSTLIHHRVSMAVNMPALSSRGEDDRSLCTPFLDRLTLVVSQNPNKVAATFLGPGPHGGKLQRQVTYQQIEDETTRLANQMHSSGIAKGDRYESEVHCFNRFRRRATSLLRRLTLEFVAEYSLESRVPFAHLLLTTSFLAVSMDAGFLVLLVCRVVLVYPPSLDFMMAFVACLKAQVIAVPVFPPHPGRQDSLRMFGTIVSSCQAHWALTNSEYNHLKKASAIKDFLTRAGASSAGSISWPELQWMVTDSSAASSKDAKRSSRSNNNGSSTTAGAAAIASSPPDPSVVAFLQFTSGSTSDPKGVMITQGNLAHNLTVITQELQAGPDTVVVSWLPQYHDMGLIGTHSFCLSFFGFLL